MERYIDHEKLDVSIAEIDFTVRGRKNTSSPKVPSAKKVKKKKTEGETVKKVLLSHPGFSKQKDFKKGLKQLKKSPSKGGKTLSQKLVVKMTFGSFKSKNKVSSSEESVEQSPEKVEKQKNKSKLTKLTVSKKKLNQESKEEPPVKKRKMSADPDKILKKTKGIQSTDKKRVERKKSFDSKSKRRKRQDSIGKSGKTSGRKDSTDKLERRKSAGTETSETRRKSTDVQSDSSVRRKSADSKSDKGRARKGDLLNRELQVMQNIKANSRSARHRKLQEDLEESAAMIESSDEDINDVVNPEKYDPYVEEEEQGDVFVDRCKVYLCYSD